VKKILALIIVGPTLVMAQVPGALSAAEVLKHQRGRDSMQVIIAQKHRETESYNDAYIKQHPNYLRQHPEILKVHPEYRKRYAKYLSHPSSAKP
jgi:hypothetical protein